MKRWPRNIGAVPSGALYHASLARFAPMQALLDAIDDVSRQVELERRFHRRG